jgi:Ca2+-transporting ATPase
MRASARRLNHKGNAANKRDTLRPEYSGKSDSEVENNKFVFSPGQLDKLLNPKNFGAFGAFGGLRGLEKGLRTNVQSGLSIGENRVGWYGEFQRGGLTDLRASTRVCLPSAIGAIV